MDKRLYSVAKIDTLRDIINLSCIKHENNIAFMEKYKGDDKFTNITFKKFREDVISFGANINNRIGIDGRKIAVIGENSYCWFVTYMATVCGNGVIIPLDKELPANEIENLIRRSGAEVIVFSNKKKDIIDSIRKNLDVKTYISMNNEENSDDTLSMKKMIEEGNDLSKDIIDKYNNIKIDKDKMSILLFTSGTTSTSKAAMLSHKNITTNIECVTKNIKEKSDDVMLSILPVHHTFECTTDLSLLYTGACIAFCQGLKYMVSDINEIKPTILLGVPLLIENIYNKIWSTIRKQGKEELVKKMINITNNIPVGRTAIKRKLFKQIHNGLGGRVRIVLSGAAPLNPDICKGFNGLGMLCLQGYGLTETAPMVAIGNDRYFKDGSVGFSTEGIDVQIDSPDKDGVGEVKVKGDNVMLGYFNDEEATNAVIKDGWFYTGDLGYFDKDGYLFISGRIKNVIVTKNGKKIFPEEIENMLNEYGIIKESMVYGFEGEEDDITVSADIVIDKDMVAENKWDANVVREKVKEIIKEINSKLVSYKSVKKFDVRENEFVKTTTMKIKRYIETINRNKKG